MNTENFQEVYHTGQFDALFAVLEYCKCDIVSKEKIIEFIEILIKREQQLLRDAIKENSK